MAVRRDTAIADFVTLGDQTFPLTIRTSRFRYSLSSKSLTIFDVMTFGMFSSIALALWLSSCCWRIESFLVSAPSSFRSITQLYPSSDVCQSKWSFLERRSKRPIKRRQHRISLSATPSDEDDDLPEEGVPRFPYSESSFKGVISKGRFYVDKTSYIK